MANLSSRKSHRPQIAPPVLPREGVPVVLVAEDHEDTRFLIKTLLNFRGIAVVEAGDGEEAVEVALRERPDLIMMDVSLPRVDGYAVTRRLRSVAALREVPIVFVSGHADEASRAAARAAGCDEYMTKPLDTALLDRILDRRLARATSRAVGESF
ncbi:MAG TPA: response regulator [Pyrinomonadaceae bacterium]|jgi:CheY-like chemotaxis protein